MENIARTKIIATIGPSTWDTEVLRSLVLNGMQLARVNASFADFEELKRVCEQIRSISPRIALILDTQGTKIRVKNLANEITVENELKISSFPTNGVQVTYPDLHRFLTSGDRIFLDDGNIEIEVKEVIGEDITCKVIQGGILKPNKTVNIPSVYLNFPTLTEKDRTDILNAKSLEYDYISLSFVRNKEDILVVRELLKDSNIKIIAKIENQMGLDNFDEILEHADAIMIARGDLGVEIDLEDLPVIQKKLIYQCRAAGKPVIVATQMLESMKESRRPTRAEVSDVANAVMDGADAVMLSAETSTGKYPLEAVSIMNRIILKAQGIMTMSPVYGDTKAGKECDEICKNVCYLSESTDIKGIIALTDLSATVGSITRHRPKLPIFVTSNSAMGIRQNSIFHSVRSVYIHDIPVFRDEAIRRAVEVIYTHGELELTDKIAIITGSSMKSSDTILEIAIVKELLN